MGYTEYETSVRLPITKNIFNLLYSKFYKKSVDKILVIYFNDPLLLNNESIRSNRGYRVSNNVFQHKHCSHRLNLLKILTNKNIVDQIQYDKHSFFKHVRETMFIPYTRTTAEENIAELSQKFSTVRDIIVRFIIFCKNNIRICLEKISESHHGGSYYFSAEIEYNTDYSVMNYENLAEKENEFWNLLSTTYLSEFYHLIDSNSIYNYVELTQLLYIPCRKFSSFHEYSCNMSHYKLKYKFDGYKGRMIYNNVKPNLIVFWDDMHNAGKIESSFLNAFPHIVFQYEIMTSKRWIILTDIIGTIVHRQLYMPEPNDVSSFFAHYPRRNINDPLLSDDFPYRTLSFTTMNSDQYHNSITNSFIIGVQFTVMSDNISSIKALSLPHTDGYIVVCNNREYKFKVPTLDVRIRNELAYLDQSPVPIFNTELLSTFLLNPHSVYEITFRKGQVIILRERFERQFTSNVEEFLTFQRELSFMSQQLQLITS